MDPIIGDQDNSPISSTHRSIKTDNALYHLKKMVVLCERLSLPPNVIEANINKNTVRAEKIPVDSVNMKYIKADLLVQADLKLAASRFSLKKEEPAVKYVSSIQNIFESKELKNHQLKKDPASGNIKLDNVVCPIKKEVVSERLNVPYNYVDVSTNKNIAKVEKASLKNADTVFVKPESRVHVESSTSAFSHASEIKPILKSVKIKEEDNADTKNIVGEKIENVVVTSAHILSGATCQDLYLKSCERPLGGNKFETKTSETLNTCRTVSMFNNRSEDRKMYSCSNATKLVKQSMDADFGSQDEESRDSDHMASAEIYADEEIPSNISRTVYPYTPRPDTLNNCTEGDKEIMVNSNINGTDKFSTSFKYDSEYSRNNSLFNEKKTKHFHGNAFTCELCSKSYFSRYNYKNHLKMHSRQRPFHCKECGLGWIFKSALNQHIKRVHLKHEKFFCNHCPRSFSYKQTLIGHLQIHEGVRPFVCKDCGKSFRQKGNLENHSVVHTKEKRFRCDACGSSFTEKGSLQKHMISHIEGKSFICYECGRGFSLKSNLYGHFKRLHVKRETVCCPHCSQSLASKASLTSHVKRMHERKEIYDCGECNKRFFSKDLLRAHIYRHTKPQQYICNDCGRVFHNRQHFILHTRIHTGFRPYKCKDCQKSFTQATALNNHVILHTGEKRYNCQFCQMKFGRKDHLYNHKRTHTK